MDEKQLANTVPEKGSKTKKPDAVWHCPVCGLRRNKGNHAKCSRITQLKAMKERGEI